VAMADAGEIRKRVLEQAEAEGQAVRKEAALAAEADAEQMRARSALAAEASVAKRRSQLLQAAEDEARQVMAKASIARVQAARSAEKEADRLRERVVAASDEDRLRTLASAETEARGIRARAVTEAAAVLCKAHGEAKVIRSVGATSTGNHCEPSQCATASDAESNEDVWDAMRRAMATAEACAAVPYTATPSSNSVTSSSADDSCKSFMSAASSDGCAVSLAEEQHLLHHPGMNLFPSAFPTSTQPSPATAAVSFSEQQSVTEKDTSVRTREAAAVSQLGFGFVANSAHEMRLRAHARSYVQSGAEFADGKAGGGGEGTPLKANMEIAAFRPVTPGQ
jgi:hypothetical protein